MRLFIVGMAIVWLASWPGTPLVLLVLAASIRRR